MVIDFHTHVFPDAIAQKTIDHLSEKGGIPPFSDGTTEGLVSRMTLAGVDLSVTLPVLTNPLKFESVNRFAAGINDFFKDRRRKLISFAGIHPKCEKIDEKMAWIAKNGFKGVKIHPDYQETFITDEGYIRIMEAAKEYGLIVLTHAGVDGGYRDMPVRCTPDLAIELIRRVSYSKFVLAHCGGNEMTDEVIEKLCGEDVYFDTAYVLRFIGREKFQKLIKKHGDDRILFATDSPWSEAGKDAEILRSFSLGKEAEDKIFFKNAQKLLGI